MVTLLRIKIKEYKQRVKNQRFAVRTNKYFDKKWVKR